MVAVIKLNDFKHMGSSGRKMPFLVPVFRSFIMEMLDNDKKHYCEHNALFVVLNAPLLIRMLYSATSRLVLTERQMSKIRVLGDTCDQKVRARLLTMIPADVLTVECGGNLRHAPGALPLPTQEDAERWYHSSHLSCKVLLKMPTEMLNELEVKDELHVPTSLAHKPHGTENMELIDGHLHVEMFDVPDRRHHEPENRELTLFEEEISLSFERFGGTLPPEKAQEPPQCSCDCCLC